MRSWPQKSSPRRTITGTPQWPRALSAAVSSMAAQNVGAQRWDRVSRVAGVGVVMIGRTMARQNAAAGGGILVRATRDLPQPDRSDRFNDAPANHRY